jgi:hypothetical protein
METFVLCDIESGLMLTMTSREVVRTIERIRSARVCRLIEANSAETKRLMCECENLTGEEWMERQNRITELFAEHAKLCEVWDKAGPTEETTR